MNNNILNTHVFELIESLEQNLSSYSKEQKPEYLHKLRLNIKKIRAVFSFASKIYKEKYHAVSLKPLFQQAGRIREIHINIELLLADPDAPDGLITMLKEKEKNLVTEFLKDDSQFQKLIREFREQLSLPEKLAHKKKIKKYFKKEKRKASKMFDKIDSEGLHEYRIKIKKILYAYRALPKKLQNKVKINTAKISKQQEKLGKWHDTYAAVEFYSHQDFSKQTAEYISKLKEREKNEFDTLLESLTDRGK